MVFQLAKDPLSFPDPSLADEDGLLAWGGDLTEERLKLAYANGIFPWFNEGDPILWFSPHERCVIFPEKIKVSKSMQQVLKHNTFTISADTAFKEVILNCAAVTRKGQQGTWITRNMRQAYLNLHRKGVAHSVEVWHEGKLAGGLYGVVMNNVFCGESMFSLVANASKAALIWLCRQSYKLIDCQMPNPHLMSLGAEMISRQAYLKILKGN